MALTKAFLKKIEEHKNLNAFLEVFTDEALENAATIDERIANKKAGKLAGLVIALKDNICYKGHKISASSKILEGFESLYSATVVERLIAEDAIIIGRLNCDEFAMGSSNENSAYGEVLNPIDNSKVPGGSSGGAAAAVKAGLCHAALGTDTGGSVRQPASHCGVIGLKPTYGRVSRYGAIAYASSFDQIGPITNNIPDLALIMEVISGSDHYDSTCSTKEVPAFTKELQLTGVKKIGYIKDCLENPGLDKEIKARLELIIKELKLQGHEVVPVDFPYLDFLVPAYYVLTTAEASSNLARYDGVHFGYRSEQSENWESVYFKSRSEGFGKEVQRRIMLGTYVLSAGYFDAYYAKAQKVRRIFRDKTDEILKTHDFILLPTTPNTAPDIGENTKDPIAMYLEDIFTVQAPLTGLPAISIPIGEHSNGMPFGIQLMGSRFSETALFAFSNEMMQNFNDN